MLEKLQIRPGERIAIISENCPEYVRAIIDLWQAKATVVPVNPSYPLQKIIDAISIASCNRMILGYRRDGSIIPWKKSPDLIKKTYHFKELDTASKPGARNKSGDALALIKVCIPNIRSLLNNSASIIFTSGSSGSPRAALHTIANHYYSALGSNENIGFNEEDTWLLSLPLYHISGLSLLMRAKIGRGNIAVNSPAQMDLSLSQLLNYSSATHISLVPAQLFRIIQDNTGLKSLKRIKALLVGGGTMSTSLLEECQKNRFPIFKSYGSTEMSSQITATSPGDSLKHMQTSGRLLKYRKLKIAPDGEILVKGMTLFKGYLSKAGASSRPNRDCLPPGTLLPVDKNGWFYTKDTGFLDAEGYLTVTGRKDLMFVCSGENIYPEEIENAIHQYHGVEEVVVVAVPDKISGKVPFAFIRSSKNNKTDFVELKKYLNLKIERFKIPKFFYDWPAGSNKPLKPDREEMAGMARKLIESTPFRG